MDFSTCFIVGFKRRDQIYQQRQNKNTFCHTIVTNAQRYISTERNPNVGTYCDFAQKQFFPAYVEIISYFRHLTKDNTLETYFTRKDFNTSNEYLKYYRTGCNLYVLHIRNHQDFATPKPVKLKFDLSTAVAAAVGLSWYALLLTNQVISKNSNGQRQSDLL